MELGFPKTSIGNLKEQLLRKTLRNVRAQGHPYVELREEGKKLIFFCTMCLAPCYGDSSLFDHLKGHFHTERLATAQVTLLKPNPWPFNDGVFFFHDDMEEKSKILPAGQNKLLDIHNAVTDSLAIVKYSGNVGAVASTESSLESEDIADCDENRRLLVIPGVLQKDEVSDLVVRHIGDGKIGARFSQKDGVSSEFHRIWCEWLGNADFTTEDVDGTPEHDFAIVTFSYNYNLGRKGLLDGFRYLLPSSPHSEAEDSGSSKGKRTKSFSDPEDITGALRNQDDSSGEESQSSNSSKSKVLFSGNDDQVVHSRIISSKTIRKQLRNQHRIASERTCDICQQKMLPNKDVAALLNRKTGKLVCSSRNLTGAFHLFHVSCLIHWILLFEVVFPKQSDEPKVKPRSRKRAKGKNGQKLEMHDKRICSTFCSECQGTGIIIDGDDLEKPTVPLSEIFHYKIKLCDARKAWIKSPEILDNCSLGFYFAQQSDEIYEEIVAPLKLLRFYRAVE
ncbi:hypothetical protein AAHA92_02816 [Salvia divinorum]|uniref:C2H2-type domain-containing protein n=1 Tax=Salvia divinorum TaxID=28513 RepID=A0ABD1IJ70_SALDI